MTLEDHFNIPEYAGNARWWVSFSALDVDKHVWEVNDINTLRLKYADNDEVSYRILSYAAHGIQDIADPAEALKVAQHVNDWIYEQIKDKPEHFGSFAVISMHDPATAAAELRRTIAKYGFKGALVNDIQIGPDGQSLMFYKNPSRDIFWNTCVELNVPFYYPH